MMNVRKITLCTILALFLGIGVPHTVPAQTLQRGVPEGYRIAAKHLAAGLHNSLEAARQYDKRPTSDFVKEFDRLILDFGKIKTDDPDVRRLVSLALPAAEEFVLRLNNIHSIPKMSNDEFLEYLAVAIMSGGVHNPGYKKSAARRDAIKEQMQKLNQASLEIIRARDLLPAIAKEYAPAPSKSPSLQVGFYELPLPHDIFHITNNGGELRDCTFEVKIQGKGDASVTSVYFVERWAKGATLWTLCTQGQDTTVSGVATIEVSVLSPDLNTTINYSYDRVEQGKTHAWFFKDVELFGSYQKKEPGVFSDWERSFTTTLEGASLPACRYSVTFIKGNENKTWYQDLDNWRDGVGQTMKPGNDKLTFEADTVKVQISFPDSTHIINGTWKIE